MTPDRRRISFVTSWASAAVLLLFSSGLRGFAAEQQQSDSSTVNSRSKVNFFVDCVRCDLDYLRTEIGFVNYVRDPAEAQVHLLVTTQRSGSGGLEYTLTFIGKNGFSGVNDTLTYNSKQSDTEDMIRSGLVRTIKLGLIRYVSKSPAAAQITISLATEETPKEERDGWDYWVLSINANTYLSGEEASTSTSVYASGSANRVTKEMKVNLSGGFNYNYNRYSYQDYNYESFSRGRNFNALVVFSIGDHWSWGGSAYTLSSTYDNTEFAFSVAPAIEYDLFPYSESTRRQLRILYKIPYTNVHYYDTTIYDKTQDQLVSENLSISLDLKEPWGSAGVSVAGSHYFFDVTKYNFGVSANLSVRVVEGLSFNVWGEYSRIHDQLSITKGGATEEEVLLQRVALETSYRYFTSFGLSYTFGSIYNNVVNPRFGNGGGGF